jgi:hypothetical protein
MASDRGLAKASMPTMFEPPCNVTEAEAGRTPRHSSDPLERGLSRVLGRFWAGACGKYRFCFSSPWL